MSKPVCRINKYGTKYWFVNGELHREDGPAIECPDGTKSWYLCGKGLSEEEHFESVSKENQIKLLFKMENRATRCA